MKEESVIFEVPCRSNNGEKPAKTLPSSFMGKLILTDKRIIFLSSGKTGTFESAAKALFFGGVAAATMRGSMEQRSAKNLDLSSLSNKGSWELPLTRAIRCEEGGSTFGAFWFVWLGPCLRFYAKDGNGSPVSFCAFSGGINGKTKGELRKHIIDAAKAAG